MLTMSKTCLSRTLAVGGALLCTLPKMMLRVPSQEERSEDLAAETEFVKEVLVAKPH
jgi:hypothetical protein